MCLKTESVVMVVSAMFKTDLVSLKMMILLSERGVVEVVNVDELICEVLIVS